MLTPTDIRRKTERAWNSGAMLRATIADEDFFPFRLAWGRPTARQLREDFAAVRDRIAELREWADADPQGRIIEWQEINHRSLGPQQLPAAILLDRDGFLRCCGRKKEYAQFLADLALIRSRLPEFEVWLANHAREIVNHGGKWEKLLAVVDYFSARPRPGIYLRQLDIPGVDTKFIEQHKKILASLLNELLPGEAVNRDAVGLARHGFERRFGLRYDEPQVRFRFLDPSTAPHPSCLDVSLPLSGFRALQPKIDLVIITENKINGLCFPEVKGAIVIFGLGYGIHTLAEVPWLRGKTVYYWGDIDTHGFSILSLVRSFLPQTRSFLMDRNTLLAHRELWGREDDAKRCLDRLRHLTHEELALYNELRENGLGEKIRFEQERISFSRVMEIADRLP